MKLIIYLLTILILLNICTKSFIARKHSFKHKNKGYSDTSQEKIFDEESLLLDGSDYSNLDFDNNDPNNESLMIRQKDDINKKNFIDAQDKLIDKYKHKEENVFKNSYNSNNDENSNLTFHNQNNESDNNFSMANGQDHTFGKQTKQEDIRKKIEFPNRKIITRKNTQLIKNLNNINKDNKELKTVSVKEIQIKRNKSFTPNQSGCLDKSRKKIVFKRKNKK